MMLDNNVLYEQRPIILTSAALMARMSEIRRDAGELPDVLKDEYLSLASQLAAAIGDMNDERVAKHVNALTIALAENDALITYDPRQHTYWKRRNPSFAETLDSLVIAVGRDMLGSMDARHHILQAIKYMSVASEPFEKKEAMYSTILPRHGAVNPSKEGGRLMRVANSMVGSQHQVEVVEDGALDLGRSPNDIGELIEFARERGYQNMRIIINRDEANRLKEQFPGRVEIKDAPPPPDSAMNKLIRFTKPISYPILGALPGKIQEWLAENYQSYNPEHAFHTSVAVEAAGSVALAAALAFGYGGLIYVVGGVPILADAVGRLFGSARSDANHPVGSIFLKPVFQLYEKDAKYRTNLALVEMTFPVEPAPSVKSPLQYLEHIAALDVPEGIEGTLLWGPANHNNFGKRFSAHVEENAGDPGKLDVEVSIDRKNQAVIFQQHVALDNYTRSSLLLCFSGQRYLITALANEAHDTASLAAILTQEIPVQDKFEGIVNATHARYVHFRRFEFGEATQDFEAIR